MKVTIVIEGIPDDIAPLIHSLYERADVHLSFKPELLAPIDWESHPALQRLTSVEREIMRLDLEHEPRRRIAQLLQLTTGTVTVYRRSIRLKLRSVPCDKHPAQVREWLRRFPGKTADVSAPEPPPEPEPPAQPENPTE